MPGSKKESSIGQLHISANFTVSGLIKRLEVEELKRCEQEGVVEKEEGRGGGEEEEEQEEEEGEPDVLSSLLGRRLDNEKKQGRDEGRGGGKGKEAEEDNDNDDEETRGKGRDKERRKGGENVVAESAGDASDQASRQGLVRGPPPIVHYPHTRFVMTPPPPSFVRPLK